MYDILTFQKVYNSIKAVEYRCSVLADHLAAVPVPVPDLDPAAASDPVLPAQESWIELLG